MGKLVIYPTIALWLLAIALLWLDRTEGSKRATTIVAVLGVVAALAAAAQVTITGHLGSTAVWKCTIGTCQ
jgi:uncharacterized membrane protein